MNIAKDLGLVADPNTDKKMGELAKRERMYDVGWGVVHPGNAFCMGVFSTKREATEYQKCNAKVFVVVKVVITPLYTQSKRP